MSRLSRQCGILDISQPYGPPRPVKGIVLLYFRNRPWRPIGLRDVEDPHCLDSWVADGGKVVTLTHQQRSTPRKHYFSDAGTRFC
jgi:hypothetical protein